MKSVEREARRVVPLVIDDQPLPIADVVIMGFPFWNVTTERIVEWCRQELGPQGGNPRVLLFANAHTLTLTKFNPSLREALKSADVIANDGVGVRIATRMRGDRIKENLNGTDLIPRLLGGLPDRTRVFLYGSPDGVNEVAALKLAATHPNITICGRLNGFVRQSEAIEAINESQADLVLVGLGHPYQDLFCINQRDEINCSVLVSCGAFFEFVAGNKPRAPKWMRRANLEWLHRLLVEPRRLWKRYLVGIPVFLLLSASSIASDRRMAKKLRLMGHAIVSPQESTDHRRFVSQTQEL